MRLCYLFLLVAVSQRGNAGPRRRDLDWDIFGSNDLGVDSGSTDSIMNDYGSNLALFDPTAADSSQTGDFNTGASSDYSFTLDDTGTDFSLGDLSLGDSSLEDSSLDSATLENSITASSTDFDLFNSDDISNSGCSSDTTASGKARRDGGMCLVRNDVKPKPGVPETKPGLNPGKRPDDPDWLRIVPKEDPPTPNRIWDPRYPWDGPPPEPEPVVPSINYQGPCPPRFTYVCCELGGQEPIYRSSTPIPECVRCM